MDKQSRKRLKEQYLKNEEQKKLERLLDPDNNSPYIEIERMLFTPVPQHVTKNFILQASNDQLEVEILKKINEEVKTLRRTGSGEVKESKYALNPHRRMLVFTSVFENMAAMGDVDKFFESSSGEEIEETINGFLLLKDLELAALIKEAQLGIILPSKVNAYLNDKKLQELKDMKAMYIKDHWQHFLYS